MIEIKLLQMVVYISLNCVMKYISQFTHRVIKLISKIFFQLQVPIKEFLSSNYLRQKPLSPKAIYLLTPIWSLDGKT